VDAEEEVPRRKARPWFVAAIAVFLVAATGALVERAAREKERRAKTEAMRHSLGAIRAAIRDFRTDQHRPPRTLQELLTGRSLRVLPSDPITGKPDWHLITEQPVRADDFARGAPPVSAASGIVDVRSSAPGADANGKAWSEY
jgi:general secretion pathway protein G